MLYVKAPAKINLTLDVLYKREDNYHEVEMVMTTIDLADRVGLALRSDTKIVLTSTDQFVPIDHRNFAYQAARLLQQRFNVSTAASIQIEKEKAAGLFIDLTCNSAKHHEESQINTRYQNLLIVAKLVVLSAKPRSVQHYFQSHDATSHNNLSFSLSAFIITNLFAIIHLWVKIVHFKKTL